MSASGTHRAAAAIAFYGGDFVAALACELQCVYERAERAHLATRVPQRTDFIIVIAATVDRHVVENTFALAISAVGTVHTAHDDRAVIVAACIPVHHRANDHKRDIGLACAVIVP